MTKPRSTLHHLRKPSGQTAPVVVILLALALSAALFFAFTAKRYQKQPAPAPQPATVANAPASAAATPAAPPAAEPAPAASTAPAAPAKPVFGFARPLDLGKDLAQSLSRQDWERAGQLAAAGAADDSAARQAAEVFAQIRALGFKSAKPEEVEVLGQMETSTRLAIPFKGADGQTQRLQIDVERDEAMGWKVTQFRLPPALAEGLAALSQPPAAAMPPGSAPAGTSPPAAAAPKSSSPAPAPAAAGSAAAAPPAPMPAAASPAARLFVVEAQQDALGFANGFVRHLLRHDFAQARSFIDESRVPPERLVGLCIVFEEGQYSLVSEKPLVMTAAGPDASWVIAQVKSDKLDQRTEFGIEMQRQAEDQPWRVIGLNLSDILGSFAGAASKIGIPYVPIVKNPKGGESIALYFEYDESGLHPRALKQLQIVAGVLKADPARRLRIAGHADALGQEDYNLRLSRQRAESVKKQLVALGVGAEQIDTTGLGTSQPLSPNQKSDGTDNPEGRSKNRRAEIFLEF